MHVNYNIVMIITSYIAFNSLLKAIFNKYNIHILLSMSLNVLEINYTLLFLLFLFLTTTHMNTKIISLYKYIVVYFILTGTSSYYNNTTLYLVQEFINTTLLIGLINIHPQFFYIFFITAVILNLFKLDLKIKYKMWNYLILSSSLSIITGSIWNFMRTDYASWWTWDPIEVVITLLTIPTILNIHKESTVNNKNSRYFLVNMNILICIVFLSLAIRGSLVTSQHSFFRNTIDTLVVSVQNRINNQTLIYIVFFWFLVLLFLINYYLYYKSRFTTLLKDITKAHNNAIYSTVSRINNWLTVYVYLCAIITVTVILMTQFVYRLPNPNIIYFIISYLFTFFFLHKLVATFFPQALYKPQPNVKSNLSKLVWNAYVYIHVLCIITYVVYSIIIHFIEYYSLNFYIFKHKRIQNFLNIDSILKFKFSRNSRMDNINTFNFSNNDLLYYYLKPKSNRISVVTGRVEYNNTTNLIMCKFKDYKNLYWWVGINETLYDDNDKPDSFLSYIGLGDTLSDTHDVDTFTNNSSQNISIVSRSTDISIKTNKQLITTTPTLIENNGVYEGTFDKVLVTPDLINFKKTQLFISICLYILLSSLWVFYNLRY